MPLRCVWVHETDKRVCLSCLLTGGVQTGSFQIPAAAAAASAASRTGQERESHTADRSTDEGVLPSGVVSICIATDGSNGCRTALGQPVQQAKIWWERPGTDGNLHFVTTPHGCGNCFRPCVREGGKWRILKKSEVRQTSAPTANGWIKAKRNAALNAASDISD